MPEWKTLLDRIEGAQKWKNPQAAVQDHILPVLKEMILAIENIETRLEDLEKKVDTLNERLGDILGAS